MTPQFFKKNPPMGWVIFLSWAIITFFIFVKLHSIRPPVVTTLYMFLVDFVPGFFITLGVIWGFFQSSRRGFWQYLSLVLLLGFWVDQIGSYFMMVDKNHEELILMVHTMSPAQHFIWTVVTPMNNAIFYFWIGWTFFNKKPCFINYETVDPFQNVLLKFVGILWILFAAYKIFECVWVFLAYLAHTI